MASEGSVTVWIGELKVGDHDAAQRLWERYFRKMVELARARLQTFRRRAGDEEDVALSAFYSFVRGAEGGRFQQLRDRDNLWPLLVVITARKAIDVRKHEAREKRGGGKVRGEAEFVGRPPFRRAAVDIDQHRGARGLDVHGTAAGEGDRRRQRLVEEGVEIDRKEGFRPMLDGGTGKGHAQFQDRRRIVDDDRVGRRRYRPGERRGEGRRRVEPRRRIALCRSVADPLPPPRQAGCLGEQGIEGWRVSADEPQPCGTLRPGEADGGQEADSVRRRQRLTALQPGIAQVQRDEPAREDEPHRPPRRLPALRLAPDLHEDAFALVEPPRPREDVTIRQKHRPIAADIDERRGERRQPLRHPAEMDAAGLGAFAAFDVELDGGARFDQRRPPLARAGSDHQLAARHGR